MIQILGISLAVMLAFALSQAVAAEKPKAPKAKKDDTSTLNFQIQHGTSTNKKKKGLKSK